MNIIELSGNLVEELKTSKTKNGKTMLQNKIAVTDNKGTDFEETYFIPFSTFSLETIKGMKGLKKGSLVKLQGKLIHKSYKKDGNWVNYTNIQIFKIEEIKFDKNGKCLNGGGFKKANETEIPSFEPTDDDIPF